MATRYVVNLTEQIKTEVTVVNSLGAARKWLRKTIFYNQKHAADLQVGVASHGVRPDVLTLCLRNKCLVISLPAVINVESYLSRFLNNGDITFVSTGPVPQALQIHSYADALGFGDQRQSFSDLAERVTNCRLELNPAVAAGDWTTWPLSQDQVILSAVQAQVAFLAALLH